MPSSGQNGLRKLVRWTERLPARISTVSTPIGTTRPVADHAGFYVITPNEGLRLADEHVDLERLRGFARVDIASNDPRYRGPLDRDVGRLAAEIGADGEVILLGSIATDKYVDPLLAAFGERLRFPADFVGRGDMSRGGLLLRCVRAGVELEYVPIREAVRRGPRPARLQPLPRRPAAGSSSQADS